MKTLLPICLAFCTSFATAQTTSVIPANSKTRVDTNYDLSYFGSSPTNLPAHILWSYDPKDVGVPAAQIKQIAFRRNNWYGNAITAHSNTLTVVMSAGPLAPPSASTTFANNHGTNKVQVFSGTVNWPASPYTGNKTNAPFLFPIKFAKAYTFVAVMGKSLVIDIVLKSTTRASSALFDASGKAIGTRVSNPRAQSTCRFSNNKYVSGIGYTLGGLTNAGGNWFVQYSNGIPNSPGVAFLSAFGVNNKSAHNLPLPFDLTALGAPGCTWNIGFDGFGLPLAFVSSASGAGRVPNLTIPPGLGGLSFFDHALMRDAKANTFGWVVTWPSEWKIAGSFSPAISTIYITRDTTAAATGRLRANYGIVTELTR